MKELPDRSSKIIWSSVKINWSTNNCGRALPAITSEIRIPFKQLRSKPVVILFSSFVPCLSHRDADAKLKDEQTSLAPFDNHMASTHGSQVSVTHRYRQSCKGNFTNFCYKQIQQSTWLGRSERSAPLFSCCRLSYFQQPHVLKSSLGRKSEHCPYPKLRRSIKRQTMNFLVK